MKILAPLRHSSEVEPLRAAGADEFYCGITPEGWSERFGSAWVHRRDPRATNVPDVADLTRIVRSAAPLPVYVTLNAPSYPPGAREFLVRFGLTLLKDLGVSALIVADLDLLLGLRDAGCASQIHASSLGACTNGGSAGFFRDLGVSRVILPRHLTLEEIETIAPCGPEIEIFLLNDGCVFEEGLCATTHAAGPFCLQDGPGTDGMEPAVLERYAFWKWTLNNCGCQTSRGYQLGPCGLCALPRFLAAGVASLKVVGREASLPRKESSVRLASDALRLARAGASPGAVRQAVIELRGASELCEEGRLCYYPDLWRHSREREAPC